MGQELIEKLQEYKINFNRDYLSQALLDLKTNDNGRNFMNQLEDEIYNENKKNLDQINKIVNIAGARSINEFDTFEDDLRYRETYGYTEHELDCMYDMAEGEHEYGLVEFN